MLGKKLKGSLLKGSFDKGMHIDLPVPLPHPTPPTLPTLFRLAHFQRKLPPTTHLNPTPNPSPKDTNRNSYPFTKTTLVKTTP